jgi:hypothetical protein
MADHSSRIGSVGDAARAAPAASGRGMDGRSLFFPKLDGWTNVMKAAVRAQVEP